MNSFLCLCRNMVSGCLWLVAELLCDRSKYRKHISCTDESQTVNSSLIFHLHCFKHHAVFINIAALPRSCHRIDVSSTEFVSASSLAHSAKEDNTADFRSKHSLIQTKRSLK